MDVPKLHVTMFSHGVDSEKYAFAKELNTSFQKYGFVKLTNHGISSEEVYQAFEWNRRFFALPEPEKLSLEGGRSRGYSFAGKEQLWLFSGEESNLQNAKEAREHYDVGPFLDDRFPTPWPNESSLPGFRDFIETFYNKCQTLSLQLLQALELDLGVPYGSLQDRCNPAASDLRLNHYPALSRAEASESNVMRIWPHTDIGLLTLLFQEGFGGLQLEDRTRPGAFQAVESDAPADAIANVGESLQRWTNDKIAAGVHQVSLLAGRDTPERRSIAFFLKPRPDVGVGSLPHFVEGGGAGKYEDVSAIQYSIHRHGSFYKE